MSWRILFEPAYFNDTPGDTAGADCIIPENVDDVYIKAIAEKWNWRLPLKIWTPSLEDPRYQRLVQLFNDDYLMDGDAFQVWVKPGKEVKNET